MLARQPCRISLQKPGAVSPGTGLIMSIAFLARLLSRLIRGEQDFWVNGYTAYYELGLRLVHGHGLCFGDRLTCAWWPPLYPTLMAAAALTPRPYLAIVIGQSLVGAMTVFCAFRLAVCLVNRTAG